MLDIFFIIQHFSNQFSLRVALKSAQHIQDNLDVNQNCQITPKVQQNIWGNDGLSPSVREKEIHIQLFSDIHENPNRLDANYDNIKKDSDTLSNIDEMPKL